MNKQILILLLLTTFLCSCEEDEYTIEMRPVGQALERKLTVARYNRKPTVGQYNRTEESKEVYSEVSPETLAAIAELYPTRLKSANPKIHSFVGTFTGRTPNDVGGAGTYKRVGTPMGSAFFYVERFRGNDRPGETLSETFRSADRLSELLTGWLKSEFGRRKEFPKIRRFMDEDFRKDIKNLSTYLWLGSNESRHIWREGQDGDDRENVQKEIAARAFQYLVERNYFAAEDLAVIMRTGEEGRLERLEPLIRKFLVAKVQLSDEKLIDELSILLTDPERLNKSLSAYLGGTDEYKKRLKEYNKELREFDKPQNLPQPDTHGDMEESASSPEPPEPYVLLEEALEPLLESIQIAFFFEFYPFDSLQVELYTAGEPVATNGKWEEKDKRIVWSTNLTPRDTQSFQLPELCYAVWCEPDEQTQAKYFGKTILLGEGLLNYCLWYESLSKEEAAQWDTLIAGSEPGEDLLKRLKAFRFSPGQTKPDKPDDDQGNYAERAIEIIKEALEPEPDEE